MTGDLGDFVHQLLYVRVAVAILLLFGASLVAIHRAAVVRGIRAYFDASTHPINLAVFRIAVFGSLLVLGFRSNAVEYAALPDELLYPPLGWTGFLEMFPPTPGLVTAGHGVLIGACLAGLVGYHSRIAALLAFGSGLYVLGVPQFYGKINHYHHVLWFAALLVASPSDDALSVRSVGRSSPEAARVYAVPLRFAWLLMGVIYLFPGFWKLWIAAPAWVSGEATRAWIVVEGARGATWLRDLFELFPLLYSLGGIGTLVFELSFIALVVSPRTRPIAAIGGIVFHILTWICMGIWFWSLALMYVSFGDWKALKNTVRTERSYSRASVPEVKSAAYGIGAILLAINFICGAIRIDSWPFAVYPQFSGIPQAVEFEPPFPCEAWPEDTAGARFRHLVNRIEAAPSAERRSREGALRRACDAPPLSDPR